MLRAFKLIGRELKPLQRRSKGLEGLGKGPGGRSIFKPPQGGFHESENLEKTNIGLQSLLDVAFLKGCGSEEKFLTFFWSVPLCTFSSTMAQEDLVPHPHGFPFSLSVPTTLLHCPLAQQPHSLSLLRQSHGTSPDLDCVH